MFKGAPNSDYIIDSIIPFIDKLNGLSDQTIVNEILNDADIKGTLEKSPATTSNVNQRLILVKKIIMERLNKCV